MDDSRTRSFAALDLSYDKLTGNLDADLDLPASSASFRFCGNIRPECADLYITADTHSYYSGWESVHLFWSASGSVLTAGCSGFGSRGAAFAADLLWTDHLKRFSLNADRESLALEVVHDNDGNYTASLSLPYQRFSADVRGVISRNLFTADASWDQSSGRDGSGTASLRLLHRDDGFDLSGSFNTRRESGNLDLRWSPMIKTLHFANGDGGAFMASVLQNEDGGIRNIQINGPAWTAEYDREKLLIRTGREEITLIGRYESEWVHVLDITRKSTDSYYYYDDNPPDTETHAGIRTELSRDGQYWALRSTVTDVTGNQSLNLSVGTAGRDVP